MASLVDPMSLAFLSDHSSVNVGELAKGVPEELLWFVLQAFLVLAWSASEVLLGAYSLIASE